MREHVPETGWFPIQANGLTFACFEEGEGPLLLLVHGFPDTPHTWDDVRPRLAAAGWRVVTPFTRGYAPSQAPASDDYGAETLGRDLLALIEALGHERAAVVGHDWGASAAYSAAHLGPERVARVATIAIPHPATIKPSLGKLWGARHFLSLRLPGAARRFARGDYAEVRALYERWSPAFDWPDAEFEAAKNAYAAPGCLEAALGYYRCLEPRPPEHFLGKIQVPGLVIGGTEDGVATAEDFERSARRFEGPCRVEMLPGGHFLHREHPEPFLSLLTEFLGDPGAL